MTFKRFFFAYCTFLLALYLVCVPLRAWRVERALQTLRLPGEVAQAALDKRFNQLMHYTLNQPNHTTHHIHRLQEAHRTLTHYYHTGS